ncbi:glycoside hydrolase family 43 protein [Saccharibacillus alkalitolerans]|uniref:Glycoside hydrolase family 43 protein n=1 Tax=Saccharibacillus alkalitolerans TaxID=2705290 RepID=A0ABX0F6H4_9BACL|nr:glycoside hydrolase family 43 protein [Saccharibacillus alkalitolerans]NGZ74771.1 glycoside hydrolase family 43 protein [Saccharibacillus alkalitolerans]
MTERYGAPDSRGAAYANPILAGCYPDPSITRAGDHYYLVTSSFEYFPGVPTFRSRDLFRWEQIGHVLTRRSQVDLRERASSSGIYASTIRHHAGRFYMITTDVRGIGNFYVTAERAEGPWSDPILLPYGNIDPSLFFDDDGRTYVTAQNGADDESHIIQYEIDPSDGRVLSEPAVIWRGDGGPWLEGPHLYKIRGRYYLMAASGGTSAEHREIIARSDSPYGPFEDKPEPILTHRELKKHPVQCLGHADLIQDDSGDWWAVFLGMRPIGGRYSPLGRETFLAPVRWTEDGWPDIDNNEGSVEACAFDAAGTLLPSGVRPADPAGEEVVSLDAGEGFGPRWAFLRDYEAERYVWGENAEGVTIVGSAYSLDDEAPATFACLRQRHVDMELSADLDYVPKAEGERAGLAARLNNRGHFFAGIARSDNRRVLLTELRNGERFERRIGGDLPAEGKIRLKLRADESGYFASYSEDGIHWTDAGLFAPVAALSPEANGGFTGVCVGLHACGAGQETQPASYSRVVYSPRS